MENTMNMQEAQQAAQKPQEAPQMEHQPQDTQRPQEAAQAAQKPQESHSMNYVHKFATPVEIQGTKYTSLTFYFEDLTGDDVEIVEQELQQRNIVVLSAEVCSPFQIGMAARAAHMPADELSRLPLREYMKIKNAARNFLVAVGY